MTNHTTGQQEWEREQWEGEGQDSPPEQHDLDEGDPRHWHKSEWEGEGQDDLPLEAHTRESAAEMGEGDSELSGHGHNPGGGKQWGDVDRES